VKKPKTKEKKKEGKESKTLGNGEFKQRRDENQQTTLSGIVVG